MLFDNPSRFAGLHDVVHGLSYDRSIAVRSCAIRSLLAVLNVDARKAISWFVESVSADSALLDTPYVERFVQSAGYHDYQAIRPVIEAMLRSTSLNAVEAGARRVCLLALDKSEAESDAEQVRCGTPTMRKAAANVYSANAANEVVGATCRRLLKPFFKDVDDTVSAEAASAFTKVASLKTPDQADLLGAFLKAKPGPDALKPVVRALESSSVQLPDLVCTLAEMCIEYFRAEAGDFSKAGAMVARDLSKIVVRLYAQTEDPTIQSRCLDLIDEMERHHFMGLSDELRRLDR